MTIPNGLLAPIFAVEFDSSNASQGAAVIEYRALLVGQKTSTGTALANSLQRVTSAAQVALLAGRGSQLHLNAEGWFENNTSTATWIGVLEDNAAGVAATGTATVTGTATAAGTISLYVGRKPVQVGVSAGDTQTTIATNIAAAATAYGDLPVTAAAATNVATFTAKNKGTCGNDIGLRLNYQDGEALPAGVAIALVQMASGVTNPVQTGLIAAMGDEWFNIITHPYTDTASLTAWETELASRFGPLRMIDGVCITSAAGTMSALATLGNGRNSQHVVLVAQPGKNPLVQPGVFAAMVAAVVALEGSADPARPFQTLPVYGALPPATADRFIYSERNLLLADGVSTTRVGPGGVVQVDRLVTTYQVNAAGSPDTAYQDLTTMLTLMFYRYSFRVQVTTKYPRHKLGNDGGNYAPGQPVMTPKLGRAEAVAWARNMESLALLENVDQFKRDVVCQRSSTDPNRLEWLLPPDLMNAFIAGAAKIQFRR